MTKIVKFTEPVLSACVEIWNSIIADGAAFPQLEPFDEQSGREYFEEQSYTGVAIDTENEEVVGLYILHPNNVGRCGHICNASYAVKKSRRGTGVGEKLVRDCIVKARELDFRILQFNAVIATNIPALSLYKKLGFVQLGTIPGGYLLKNGRYEDIIPHYIEL